MSYAQNNFSKIAHCAVLLGMASSVPAIGLKANTSVAKGGLSLAAQCLTVGNPTNDRHRTRIFDIC
jgi:hypothetical protein